MPARIEIAAERIAEGKILYEQTDTSVLEICARMGVSRNVLYARIGGWKWQRRRYTSGSAADAESSEVPMVTDRSTQAEAEDSALEPPEVFYARVCRGCNFYLSCGGRRAIRAMANREPESRDRPL
jgi:transposase-like protein